MWIFLGIYIILDRSELILLSISVLNFKCLNNPFGFTGGRSRAGLCTGVSDSFYCLFHARDFLTQLSAVGIIPYGRPWPSPSSTGPAPDL